MSQLLEDATEGAALREKIDALEKQVVQLSDELEHARNLPRRQMLWTGGMLWNLWAGSALRQSGTKLYAALLRPRIHRRYREKLRVRAAEFLAALTSRLLWISLFGVVGIASTIAFSFLQYRLLDTQTVIAGRQLTLTQRQTDIQATQIDIAEMQQSLGMGPAIRELLDTEARDEGHRFASDGARSRAGWQYESEWIDKVPLKRVDLAGASLLHRQVAKSEGMRDIVRLYLDSESPFIALGAAIALSGNEQECSATLENRTVSRFRLGEDTKRIIAGVCMKGVDFLNAVIKNIEFRGSVVEGLTIADSTFEFVSFARSKLAGIEISRSEWLGFWLIDTKIDNLLIDQRFQINPSWRSLIIQNVSAEHIHLAGCNNASIEIGRSRVSRLWLDHCHTDGLHLHDSRIGLTVENSILTGVEWTAITGDISIVNSVLAVDRRVPPARAERTVFLVWNPTPTRGGGNLDVDRFRNILASVCRGENVRVFDQHDYLPLARSISDDRLAWISSPLDQASKTLPKLYTEVPSRIVESVMPACP